mgnify:CR=1 FL=1
MFNNALLKERRKIKGLTQYDASKIIGVARTTYADYENGKIQPPIDKIRKISEWLDLPLEKLMNIQYADYAELDCKPEIVNAIAAHHDEEEMTTMIAPIVQVCDAISGARPGARREIVEAYIKRLNDLEAIAMSYPGVTKTYAIQAGRELRVIVGADKMDDAESEKLSSEIATKIQNEMTYPGQVKITVIRETRSVAYAK